MLISQEKVEVIYGSNKKQGLLITYSYMCYTVVILTDHSNEESLRYKFR